MYLSAKPWIARLVMATLLTSCWRISPVQADQDADGIELLNSVAESYTLLVLQIGNYDDAYVDYYYGPEELRLEAQSSDLSLQEIRSRAEALLTDLTALDEKSWDDLSRLRYQSLNRHLISLAGRTRLLEGETLDIDQEFELIYDTLVPALQDTLIAQIHEQLDALLPGSGPIPARYAALRNDFVVPSDRVAQVFQAAVEESRFRTHHHIELPAEESFGIEFVNGVSWWAYIRYLGDFRSLIQVNTDVPFAVDELLSLACHEGYPGHHSNFVLWEKHLYKDRGWIEYSVYPLFSPTTVMLEGVAQYAVDLAFPPVDRLAFLKSTLLPLAGLDPNRADLYISVRKLVLDLDYVEMDVARRYLNGELDRQKVIQRLTGIALMPLEHAEKAIDFCDQYRAYAMSYAIGRRLVKDHIEWESGGDPEILWSRFAELIKSPMVPAAKN